MLALVCAHTHREKPSIVIGDGQKCVDTANPRSSDTNLGLMKLSKFTDTANTSWENLNYRVSQTASAFGCDKPEE